MRKCCVWRLSLFTATGPQWKYVFTLFVSCTDIDRASTTWVRDIVFPRPALSQHSTGRAECSAIGLLFCQIHSSLCRIYSSSNNILPIRCYGARYLKLMLMSCFVDFWPGSPASCNWSTCVLLVLMFATCGRISIVCRCYLYIVNIAIVYVCEYSVQLLLRYFHSKDYVCVKMVNHLYGKKENKLCIDDGLRCS